MSKTLRKYGLKKKKQRISGKKISEKKEIGYNIVQASYIVLGLLNIKQWTYNTVAVC